MNLNRAKKWRANLFGTNQEDEEILVRERKIYLELKEAFLGGEQEADNDNLEINNPLSDAVDVCTYIETSRPAKQILVYHF